MIWSLLGLWLWSTLLLQVSTQESSVPTSHIVDTGYARYQGTFTAPFSVAYLGVPYAAPPLGSLRFRAPQSLDIAALRKDRDSGKINDATAYPDFCVQGSTGEGDAGGAGSEDCLKVNVFAPVNATSTSKLPVLVYIHGGGYVYGNPRNWPFEHWINQSPNVVIVSVYYRLDSFGFLAHPSFSNSASGSSTKPADLNAGFLDQVASLQWVHDHIAAFGGDPARVTINGESAGGSSVVLHMVGNSASKLKQLFSGAIAQSIYRTPLATPAQMEPMFNFFVNQAGCGGKASLVATLDCLREASISAIARAQDATAQSTGKPYNKFTPTLDGNIFKDYPSASLIKGDFAKVPVIVGATSNETVIGGSDIVTALQGFFPQLTKDDLSQFKTVYDISHFSSTDEQFRTATGDVALRCGRDILGGVVTANGLKAFTYRYNQAVPTQNNPGVVEHASENWMMFLGTSTGANGSTTFTQLNPVETAFSQELIAYWISFVRSSDPSTFKLQQSPVWPAFAPMTDSLFLDGTASLGRRVVLQEDPDGTTTNSGILIEDEPFAEASRCAFVASKVRRTQD